LGSSETTNARAFRSDFLPGAFDFIATSDSRDIPFDQIILPLSDNGGPTLTHALPEESPAVNNGNAATCNAIDQRGELRNVNRCDIGAVESPFLVGAFEGELDFNETFFTIPLNNGKTVIFGL